MKKTIILFALAAASFLLFAYIDEYENLVLPLLSQTTSERPSDFYQEQISETAKEAILAFGSALSKAHLAGDPSLLPTELIGERLHASIAEEIFYLKREGRLMDLDVRDPKIEMIRFLSPRLMQIDTTETVRLRYISTGDKKEIIAYPDAKQGMVYTLENVGGKWKISSFDARGQKP